jgi:hypothetical protein
MKSVTLRFLLILFAVFVYPLWPAESASGASLGEIVLTQPEHAKVATLIANDPEARRLFADIVDKARTALADTPHPIDVVRSEGKLMGDPVKTQSLESLRDIFKMEYLAWAASFSAPADAPPFYDKARQFLLAWAAVNHSNGDPIDDTHLESALTAYDLTRSAFTADEQAEVEQWFHQAASVEERTGHWDSHPRWNNWNSHRLKVVGLIAFLLDDKAMQARVDAAYRDQIEHNLNPDGTTYDFIERDALHYHVYDLEPLLTLAIAARLNGEDFYDESASNGASLARSLDFLVPFCNGSKTHPEFMNSKVGFDKARARNGEAKYVSGRLYDPAEAVNVLSLGAAFDPKYAVVEHQLQKPAPTRFGTWRDVLDAAQSPAR